MASDCEIWYAVDMSYKVPKEKFGCLSNALLATEICKLRSSLDYLSCKDGVILGMKQ